MLKNIPKIISPDLLKVLCEMGHGDEIVIADGNFPLPQMQIFSLEQTVFPPAICLMQFLNCFHLTGMIQTILCLWKSVMAIPQIQVSGTNMLKL